MRTAGDRRPGPRRARSRNRQRQRALLFLDQQQVGIGRLVDAQMPALDIDLGELGGDTASVETVAGVDQLDETFRSDAGVLAGGACRPRLRPPFSAASAARAVAASVRFLRQSSYCGLSRCNNIGWARRGYRSIAWRAASSHQKHADRLARDPAQPLVADRGAPALSAPASPTVRASAVRSRMREMAGAAGRGEVGRGARSSDRCQAAASAPRIAGGIPPPTRRCRRWGR